MRYPADHKEKTRERVLAEAGNEIRKEGPHRVSVASVMKRAGLTHGGFYAHFKNKDAMVAAALEVMFEGARERWQALTEGKSAADGLAGYVDWYLSKAHRDSRDDGCAIAALSSDLPRMPGPCKRVYAGGVRGVTELVAAHITQLGHEDALSLASSVIAEMVGSLSIARGEPDGARSDALLVAARASIKRRLGLPAK